MSARIIESYLHQRRVGVLVEISAESDFAPLTDEFKTFARNVAMQIAAMSPTSISELLQQASVIDPEVSVARSLELLASKLREHIRIVRYVRWDTNSPLGVATEPPRSPAPALQAGRSVDAA